MRYLLFIVLLGVGCGQLSTSHDGVEPLDDRLASAPLADSMTADPIVARRLAWQKPDMLIESLGDLSDKTVVDIGAGTGYFTFRLAKSAKKVIAVDIDQKMLNLIEIFRENLDSTNQAKVETRLVPFDDPKLKSEEADVAVIINTISYIEDRVSYLKKVHQGLTKDGVVMIVDFKMGEVPENIAPKEENRVEMTGVVENLRAAGFDILSANDQRLDYQYIIWAIR